MGREVSIALMSGKKGQGWKINVQLLFLVH